MRKMIENVPEAVSIIHTSPPTENYKMISRKILRRRKIRKINQRERNRDPPLKGVIRRMVIL